AAQRHPLFFRGCVLFAHPRRAAQTGLAPCAALDSTHGETTAAEALRPPAARAAATRQIAVGTRACATTGSLIADKFAEPDLVQPERVKYGRAIPQPAAKIVPRSAEQLRVKPCQTRCVRRENFSFDPLAQRADEPAPQR